jgi:hypothetical protein
MGKDLNARSARTSPLMVSKNQVLNYSPSLADKKAINSSLSTIDEIVTQLGEVLDEKQT